MPRKPTTVYSVWPAARPDDVPTAIDQALTTGPRTTPRHLSTWPMKAGCWLHPAPGNMPRQLQAKLF